MKKTAIGLMVLALVGCGKEETKPANKPTVTIGPVTATINGEPATVTQTTVTANGAVVQVVDNEPALTEFEKEQQAKEEALKVEYTSISPTIKACTDTLAKTAEGTLKQWATSVSAKCSKLSKTDQLKASSLVAAIRDDIYFYGYSDVAAILEAVKKGSRQPFEFRSANADAEWLALNGNYQAQRNYAFLLGQKGDAVNECAWRAVIIDSGHKDSHSGDVSNLKVACGKLDQTQILLAQSKEKSLMLEVIENTN
jgi:hypothetical protein